MKITVTIDIPNQVVEQVINDLMGNFPEASIGGNLRCTSYNYRDCRFTFEDTEGKEHIITMEKLKAVFPLLFDVTKWGLGRTQAPVSTDFDQWDQWLCQADAGDFQFFVELAVYGEAQ